MDPKQPHDPSESLEALQARLSLACNWRESYSQAARSLHQLLQPQEASLAVVRTGGRMADVFQLRPDGVDDGSNSVALADTVFGQVLRDNRGDYEPWASSLVLPVPSLGATEGALQVIKPGIDSFEPEDFETIARYVEVLSAQLHRFESRAAEVSPLAGQTMAGTFGRSTVDQLSWL